MLMQMKEVGLIRYLMCSSLIGEPNNTNWCKYVAITIIICQYEEIATSLNGYGDGDYWNLT